MTTRLAARTVLRRAISGQARLVAGSAALFMSWQACESLVPVVIGAVIDHAIGPRDGRAIGGWIAVLAALFLVLSLSFRFGSRLARQASEQAAHEARVDVATSVLDPRAAPDPTRQAGAAVSVAGSDADRVGAFCAVLPRACGALVSVLVAAIVLLRISVPLGLLVLLGCPVLLAAVHLLGGPLERRSGVEQARAAEAAALATDLVGGLRVLKGIGGERVAAGRYHAASQRSLLATLRAAGAEAVYNAATLLLTMCFLAVVALVGGRFAAEGRISVGDLVAAVGLAQFLIGPLSQLSATGGMLAKARASAARVAALLEAARRDAGQAVSTGSVPTERMPAALTVRSGGLEFTASGGEILGVVATATEATALVELLAGARYCDTDEVTIGGQPSRSLDPETVAATLLVARHDEHLFAETVRDNVSAGIAAGGEMPGRGGATSGQAEEDARLHAAIVASDTDEVAASLPLGLDTPLTERGRSLSGGQRQRVALARALAAEAPVLVLHDPTTAVDAATEARIASGLRRLRAGQTTVIVASSPALLAACDRVLLVIDGQVRGAGGHAELSAGSPAYRELVLA